MEFPASRSGVQGRLRSDPVTEAGHAESLRYAEREGEIVHVSEVASGLSCGCVCIACHEPLVAKKGAILVHHFAHVAETNCNPTPESLTHHFAKHFIARELSALEPLHEVRAEARELEAWARMPAQWFIGDAAEVEPQEYKEKGFVPDVVIARGARKLAIEVYFRHPVPSDKVELLKRRYVHAVEVDLSDLPNNAAPGDLKTALSEVHRWRWLNNQSGLANEIQNQVDASSRTYTPPFAQLRQQSTPTCSSPQYPQNKIAEAEGCVDAAEAWLQLPIGERSSYADLPPEMKLALHCHYLGLRPKELPLTLMQTVHGQSLLGRVHCMYWQTWFFAKFCIGTTPVDLGAVEQAARLAYPDLRSLRATLQTGNGFSPTRQLFYELLLQLAMQGMVSQVTGPKAWLHTFSPRAKNRTEARRLLLNERLPQGLFQP